MNDQVSAFLDGELDASTADSCLDRMCRDQDLRNAWVLFHLIGDHLRGEAAQIPVDFSQRFSERLALEPTLSRPRAVPSWFPLSLAASVIAVAGLAWALLTTSPQALEWARAPKFVPADAESVRQSIPAGARDYLIAHQGVSSSVALQGLGSYVRTVADPDQGSGIQKK